MNRQRIEQAVAPEASTMDAPRRPVPPPTPAPAAGRQQMVPVEEDRPNRPPLVVTAPAAKPIPVYPPKIAKAILAISKGLGVVEKYGFNDFHKYRYPKWEDVAAELFPAIVENGLIITQSEIAHGGFAGDLIEISYGFTIINEDGDVWPERPEITAICKVRDKQGTMDDKAASKCFTQAAKYMYIGLFKIRVQDAAEADANPKAEPPPRRRPVPSPTGRVAPMMIEAVKGETAKSWSEKIIGYVIKADTLDELDQWEKLNSAFLDRLEENDDPTFHNNVVDAFTLREKQLGKPAEPATNNVAAVQQADEQASQPVARRAPPPPPQTKVTARNLSDDDLDWLEGLKGAFSGCEDMAGLADEVDRLMKPHRTNVSEEAWLRAEALQDAAIERINEG